MVVLRRRREAETRHSALGAQETSVPVVRCSGSSSRARQHARDVRGARRGHAAEAPRRAAPRRVPAEERGRLSRADPAGFQVRSRKHTRQDCGRALVAKGDGHPTPHPVDLRMTAPVPVIFEAKIPGSRGPGAAIREAVGQLFEYRFFIAPSPHQPAAIRARRLIPWRPRGGGTASEPRRITHPQGGEQHRRACHPRWAFAIPPLARARKAPTSVAIAATSASGGAMATAAKARDASPARESAPASSPVRSPDGTR